MNPTLHYIAKSLQRRTPLRRYFIPRYGYNFTPPQLSELGAGLDATRAVPGSIVEIGCDQGATTVFLNRWMDAEGVEKTYYAIDTFAGFVDEDISYEVKERGKRADKVRGFQVNKKSWYDQTMRFNKISRVQSIQADVNEFDFSSLGPLSFVLLDVDLYRPTRACLPRIYDALGVGGRIVVDDCDPHHESWDGAAQAYREFMSEMNQPPNVVHGKLGIIDKLQ